MSLTVFIDRVVRSERHRVLREIWEHGLILSKTEETFLSLLRCPRDNACCCRTLANIRGELSRVVYKCFGKVTDLLTLLALISPDQVIFNAVRVDCDSCQLAICVGKYAICHQLQIKTPRLEGSQQKIVGTFELFTINLVVAKFDTLPHKLHCRFFVRCCSQGCNQVFHPLGLGAEVNGFRSCHYRYHLCVSESCPVNWMGRIDTNIHNDTAI